ncbi:MAG: ABC transporter substrate-binding protein, partial [Proteobacteria bacterium]|nr:ABC transporter substrate-binding protein [Pseudomonadota bacterium]
MFVGAPIVIATMVLWSLACDSLRVNTSEIEYTNPVKVAFLGPVTVTRAMSESRYHAAFMAAEEINEAGGVLGRDIELVPRNDGGSKVIGVAAARQLHEEGIDIIIGPGRSVVVLEIAPQVTIPNGMLVISYAATSPLISTLADSGLVWRICPSDTYQGKIGADYCYNTLSKMTVGILAVQNPWALGLADSFEDSFESFGGTVTDYVIYPELPGSEISSYDYSPHLDTLFSGQPAMVYLACFGRDGARITNDIVAGNYIDDGYDPFFFSCDGLHTQDFIVNGHPAVLEGMHGTVPSPDEEDPDNILFLENYNRRFGIAPPNYSQHAYDALYLVAYGILRANSA